MPSDRPQPKSLGAAWEGSSLLAFSPHLKPEEGEGAGAGKHWASGISQGQGQVLSLLW